MFQNDTLQNTTCVDKDSLTERVINMITSLGCNGGDHDTSTSQVDIKLYT